MNYNDVISSDRVVLVEFYASWCPHCPRMMPIVEQVKELLADRVPVYQFDIDKNEEIADEAGVQSIPTFLVYVGGQPVWRHSGEIEGDVLLNKVESFI